jgi:radical SAM enzyme (TIGR01210 family)
MTPAPDAGNAAGFGSWIRSQRGERNSVDSRRPYSFLIEQERAASGDIVPVVTIFLTNRECPWRCVYCDLWKNTLEQSIPPGAIPEQIDFALARLAQSSTAVPAASAGLASPDDGVQVGHAGGTPVLLSATPPRPHLKLYNAGSFFDPRAIPPEDYPSIAARARAFGHVIVECHPSLVNDRVLRFRDLLPPGVTLEVAMGLETAHHEVLAKLNKRMTLADFARAAEFLHTQQIALRSFILVKPPFETDEAEALNWSNRSLEFAFDCHSAVAVLIPVRGGNGALEELARLGQFSPPALATLEAALDHGIALRRGRVFADVWDVEKFAACPACASARRSRLIRMNARQEIAAQVQCVSCGDR